MVYSIVVNDTFLNQLLGHRGQAIIEKVKAGKADVGAAAIGDSIRKDDPSLRIIHVSSKIPGAGVYLSPNLSEADKESLKKVMLSASDEIQKDANYGANIPKPDYSEFREIIDKVETILVCSDFTKNPVNLFCLEPPYQVAGKVNGVSARGNNYLIRLVAESKNIHNVAVPKDLFVKIFGTNDLNNIQGKSLEIIVPMSQQTNQGLDIEITLPQQIQIIN